MIALVASVLVASLIGSPHCAGMCGGFVCFVAGQEEGRRWRVQAAYHGGRLLTYVLLGVLAGAAGAALDHWGAGRGVTRLATIVAGAVMMLWGGATLARAAGFALPLTRLTAGAHRPLAALLRGVRNQPPALRALLVGLATTLLPCGWLYAFVATAGGSGSPVSGALVMAAFWLGTVPVLAGLGIAAQAAFGPLRRRLPVFSAALLIVIGLLTVAGKFRAPVLAATHTPGAAGAAHDCH